MSMNYTRKNYAKRTEYTPIDPSLRLQPKEVEHVIRSVRLYFLYQDNPPADQIIVYPQSVHRDAEDQNKIVAKVNIVKGYCGTKSHKIDVKFNVNNQFHCIADTLRYV